MAARKSALSDGGGGARADSTATRHSPVLNWSQTLNPPPSQAGIRRRSRPFGKRRPILHDDHAARASRSGLGPPHEEPAPVRPDTVGAEPGPIRGAVVEERDGGADLENRRPRDGRHHEHALPLAATIDDAFEVEQLAT